MSYYPVEAKVIASVVGAAGGTTLGSFLLWILGISAWHAPNDAAYAENAKAAVPAPVSAIVLLLISTSAVAIIGYLAPHTPRPPEPPPDDVPPLAEPVTVAPRS